MLLRFTNDRSGTISILFAGIIIPAVAAVGMSIDYARALRSKTHLQAVVDAAAAAGARLPATSHTNRTQAAKNVFASNISSSELSDILPKISANNSEVTVTVTASLPTSFMGVVGINTMAVSAKATARSQIENGGVACLLALNKTSSDGLHLQGINKVSSKNCWAWVNSTATTAINGTGTSLGTAQGFCTAGGVEGAEHFQPSPYTECSPIEDPFHDKFVQYTVPTSCDETNLELKSGTYVLTPGVYCGDTVLKPHAHVTLLPGLYVMKDGYFQIQAGASLTGVGVTLFFYGADTQMEVRGGAEVDLRAPTSGDLASFVIVDRKLDWYDPSIRETVIQGGGRIRLEGVVYAPQWKINISGNGEMNQESEFFTMVADTFYLEGNGRLHVKSNSASTNYPEVMPKIATGPVILK